MSRTLVGGVAMCLVASRLSAQSIPGMPRVRERLVRYDPEAMTLTYEAAEGMPRIVRHATSTMTVSPSRLIGECSGG